MCQTIRKQQHMNRNNLRAQMATMTEEKIALPAGALENVAKDVIATVDMKMENEKVLRYDSFL